jgi:cyclic pyranopterin phosphate synthase
MPEDVKFLDRSELLTFEEMAEFVRVGAQLGIDKVRLTGGEPLMRRHLHQLVQLLVQIPSIRDVGLTTNGIFLADQAQALFDAGLRRINVSLDTLDPERFQQISRRKGLEQVLEGIAEARRLGFAPIKVNAVIIRGTNDEDVVPLALWSRDLGLEMRFIEYMPIGADSWERERVFPAREMLEVLERGIAHLVPAEDYDPRSPAMDFQYSDGSGRIGIIASVSRPFCRSCNRLRLTADGKLRNCLFALDEIDVKPLLRPRPEPLHLAEVIRRNVWEKWEGHEINSSRFIKPLRTMHTIGG